MKKFLLLIILSFIAYYITQNYSCNTSTLTYIKDSQLIDNLKSSCLITTQYQDIFGIYKYRLGSGTIINEDENFYYILTNGHIVDQGIKYYVEFFDNGYKLDKVPAYLYLISYTYATTNDLAILRLDKIDLNDFVPNVIPLSKDNIDLEEDLLIYGSGYPRGKWNMIWIGRIIDLDEHTIYINMRPCHGQSGSGIIAEIDGELRVVGIVTWMNPDHGRAISSNTIHDIIHGTHIGQTLN